MKNTNAIARKRHDCVIVYYYKQNVAHSTSWKYHDMINIFDDRKFQNRNSLKSNTIQQFIFKIHFCVFFLSSNLKFDIKS